MLLMDNIKSLRVILFFCQTTSSFSWSLRWASNHFSWAVVILFKQQQAGRLFYDNITLDYWFNKFSLELYVSNIWQKVFVSPALDPTCYIYIYLYSLQKQELF